MLDFVRRNVRDSFSKLVSSDTFSHGFFESDPLEIATV